MLLPNQSVTFTSSTTGLSVTTRAQVYPAMRDARLDPEAAQFQWAVSWSSALTYTDGKSVASGHTITWNALTLPAHQSVLRRVRRTYGPLAHSTAYFMEED